MGAGIYQQHVVPHFGGWKPRALFRDETARDCAAEMFKFAAPDWLRVPAYDPHKPLRAVVAPIAAVRQPQKAVKPQIEASEHAANTKTAALHKCPGHLRHCEKLIPGKQALCGTCRKNKTRKPGKA